MMKLKSFSKILLQTLNKFRYTNKVKIIKVNGDNMNLDKRKIIFFSIIVVFISLIIWGMVALATVGTIKIKEEKVVTINKNSGANLIATTLKDNKIIKSKFFFVNHIKKNDAATKLKPGTYKFGPGKVTFDDILEKLLKGEQEEHINITIPEGYTVKQIARLFADKGLVTEEAFLEYAKNMEIPYDYIEKTGEYRQLEGFLFPDTYQIPISWKEDKIINKLLSEFDKNFTTELREGAKEIGYSIKDIVTIASLIEREARVEKERPTISGVIHNRLKKGMLLQIDATVQYLLPEQKERLLYKDLEVDSPYNTYKYAGLPPTPIATPGISCIKAALYPEEHDYLYYRTKASGNGEHWFTKTFEEHVNHKGK